MRWSRLDRKDWKTSQHEQTRQAGAVVTNTATLRPVRHESCNTLVEWCRHVTGAQITSNAHDYLWCPTCKRVVTTSELVPSGSVCLTFD